RSCYFLDPKTGAISSRLYGPSAGSFNTNGSNELLLGATDITLASGVTPTTFFNTVSKFTVVLTDGGQYAPQTSGTLYYDCRSISAMTSLSGS
ncbi:MAG TPA: hypothetical protein VFI08_09910, partial [Spirochaetia bacterium]|nr:hypothetical protein [Spirochaetia bacterium]